MKISKIFNLNRTQYELDFIDVDVKKDKRLFVDPVLISRGEDVWSQDALETIGSFFGFLIDLLKNKKYDEAFQLFDGLKEPNETCLGMSKGKPRGRGVGPMDTRKIFQSLKSSKAVKTGLVSDIEDCMIFVDNFGPDKLSDMTTNIIRGHLIDYTKDQCLLWGIPLKKGVPSGRVWNRRKMIWEDGYDEALVINNKKILLIPKAIVSLWGSVSAADFHQKDVLEFLQQQHLSLNSALVEYRSEKGKLAGEKYVTKKSLKTKGNAAFSKEYLTSFSLRHKKVFDEYKERAKSEAEKLSNDKITDVLNASSICTKLINELEAVTAGPANATKYHRLATAILDFLFYPELTHPKVEKEIDEGRKRIDITFNNGAESGFFASAPYKYSIPAQIIFIECKNYTQDPHNPELDQLVGRFSPQKGKLGLLLCRSVSDKTLLKQRCADHWKAQRGLIIPIWDEDLKKVLSDLRLGEESDMNAFLNRRALEVVDLS